MKRKTFLTLGLVAIFMLAACVPEAAPPSADPERAATEPSALAPTDEVQPTQAEADAPTAAPIAATEAPAEAEATAEVMAQPTSRGNQLVATDPTTVNLNSGQPQLIEFFAFW